MVVDSQVPVVDPAGGSAGDAKGYTCYLAAPGVIRTGSQFSLSIEQDCDILSLQDVMSVTYNRIDHVPGTSYGGSMHPENSDLATAGNWTLAYTSHENVPLIELIVNTLMAQPCDLALDRLNGALGAPCASSLRLHPGSPADGWHCPPHGHRNGVSNVIDCLYAEVKETRLRLSREGWVLYHSEVL